LGNSNPKYLELVDSQENIAEAQFNGMKRKSNDKLEREGERKQRRRLRTRVHPTPTPTRLTSETRRLY
jgi:hypothetical protein